MAMRNDGIAVRQVQRLRDIPFDVDVLGERGELLGVDLAPHGRDCVDGQIPQPTSTRADRSPDSKLDTVPSVT
jgi:hypothetical protein